jgi:hypothetical protein
VTQRHWIGVAPGALEVTDRGFSCSMPAWTPVGQCPLEITVGKHAAPEGSTAHPLVAAALARRPDDVAGAHRQDGGPPAEREPVREGGVGWPGPEPGDGGLGWPGNMSPGTGTTAEKPAPTVFRRGWRRFFGRVA